jgi:hypothetical protein
MGLAQALQDSTRRALGGRQQVRALLHLMHEAVKETERRCGELAGEFKGKKGALQSKARETKSEGQAMMKIYLGDGDDALGALEFLIMGRGRGARQRGDRPRDERAGRRPADRRTRRLGPADPGAARQGYARRRLEARRCRRPERTGGIGITVCD